VGGLVEQVFASLPNYPNPYTYCSLSDTFQIRLLTKPLSTKGFLNWYNRCLTEYKKLLNHGKILNDKMNNIAFIAMKNASTPAHFYCNAQSNTIDRNKGMLFSKSFMQ